MIVYADILFIVNLYVTYLLLRLTQLLAHEPLRRGRLVLSSLCGGAYALVIYLPLPWWALAISRTAVAAVLIVAAFPVKARRQFLRLYATFFAMNFAFAGLMFALWYFLRPRAMQWYGSVVYFDLHVPLLVGLTAACYFLLLLAQKLASLRRPPDALFSLTITLRSNRVTCSALLDTGNTLTEPFSAYPVIVAEAAVCAPLLDGQSDLLLRYVPCSVVGAKTLLRAFRPESVRIRGVKTDVTTDAVYVALTDTPLRNGAFQALLQPALLQTESTKRR